MKILAWRKVIPWYQKCHYGSLIRERAWLRSSGNELLYVCLVLFILFLFLHLDAVIDLPHDWFFSLHFVREKIIEVAFFYPSRDIFEPSYFTSWIKKHLCVVLRIQYTLTFNLLMPFLESWKYSTKYTIWLVKPHV